MKKVLLASTALVLSAGVAAADLSLGGSANFGLAYDDSRTDDELFLKYELDFGISGATTTDSGLAVGASIDLDQQIDSTTGNPTNEDDEGPSDPEVFISGSFGTLTVGDVDFAVDALGISDAGFDGIGLDDDAEALRDAGGAVANVQYEYVFGDVSIIVTYHTIEEDFGLVGEYDGGTFSVGLGYQTDESTDENTVTLVGDVSFGDVTVGGIYSDWSGDATAYGIDVNYSTGPLTVTAVYGVLDIDGVDNDDDFGIGIEYDLGGSVSLGAGLGSVNDATVADFGINMSF
ncbi:MAG: porin [Pseudomonadota bacterium]